MNRTEIRYRYHISEQALEDFDTWRIKQPNQADSNSQTEEYFDKDLPIIRTIMNLRNLDFDSLEISDYLQVDTARQISIQKKLLKKKRKQKLSDIHKFESQIASIDYLRFQLNDN